ncbi:MAG: chromosomal replication initiator protein DnaA [Anaerolineales bacterium]
MRDMEPSDAWLATLGQLELQLHTATYETWVQEAYYVAYADSVFTIAVPNAYAKDWLDKRLYRTICRALSNVFKQEVTIDFIVQPLPRKEQPLKDAPLLKADLEAAAGNPNPAPQPTSTAARLQTPAVERPPEMPFGQGDQLHEAYTLEAFLPGRNNQMAAAAAQAIVIGPGQRYNPLYIHGGVGQGKTHYIHAIGNALQAVGKRVISIRAETFTNDLIRAIRKSQTEAFRDYYRTADAFIVDEVQFIGGKDSTQEEFFHTFEALFHRGCQIILAGSQAPQHIDALQERLRSRFEGGLTIQLCSPEPAIRASILQRKAEQQGMELPDDVAQMLARDLHGSVRDMEGVLNQVLARAALTRQPLDTALVAEMFDSQTVQATSQPNLGLEDIFEGTARYHQLTLDDLLGKKRNQAVSRARHIAIYMARQELNATLPAIGRALGGRSHSTVLSGYRKIEEMVDTDPLFRRELKQLRAQLYGQSR